ncbi:hypothetical protein F4680DRAFT_464665 [Xylaria scruposa]|nr:hypothetical protein F4680DRAFT_464665 [Xylaria scruposa]
MEFATESLAPLTDGDLNKVFTYSGAPATVITCLQSQAELVKEEYVEDKEWNTLIREKLPSVTKRDGDSGFVLLIAPRILRNEHSIHSKFPAYVNNEEGVTNPGGREIIIAENEELFSQGGQRHTRVLPFSRAVFSRITKAFYTHRSISPAISRADVPLFSQEEVTMPDELDGVKARVYNCRSTNAWGGDLAMTITHFPHCKLSFGILFGCTHSQKNYVIQRLSLATRESAHPLLLPGMFAELERNRHNQIFESVVSKLELMISVPALEGFSNQRHLGDHSYSQARRDVYLDILHLKHGLTTWSRQLKKMLEHAWTLDAEYVGTLHPVDIQMETLPREGSETAADLLLRDNVSDEDALIYEGRSSTQSSTGHRNGGLNTGLPPTPHQATMTKANIRTIKRIKTILESYSDKIRECQTRFDGLTLTTQLFQGETSVLLALAASRDSYHMRTIALVTMIFLPGTFFATIFSMTFFDWKAKDGESTVSSMFWIYVAFSVISTIVTLLVYYYSVARCTKKALRSSV